MLRGTRSLIFDTINEMPYLIRSKHKTKIKWQIFLTYILISIKLFTLHRISKLTQENILGLKVSFFDYGTLHFLFREIFIRNEYYFHATKKNPLIFDCGANIGIATLFFKWLYPESTIYAFEPDPHTFALLEKNIQQNNFKNVYLYNIALLDKKGKTNFYIDKEHPGWLTMSIHQERLPKDKIVIKTNKLSNFIKKKAVDFLKMDVEGAELQVMQELVTTKKFQAIKEMIIEYHHGIGDRLLAFSDFLSLFEKNNFKYRIGTNDLTLYKKDIFQDISIYAYKAK